MITRSSGVTLIHTCITLYVYMHDYVCILKCVCAQMHKCECAYGSACMYVLIVCDRERERERERE